jgi:EpsD family peptidyl-prolyl cis-trans isomerase
MSASFSFFLGKRQTLSAAAIAFTLAVTACNKSGPSGQTVATVNGEAITQSELNFELGLSGASASNWKALQPKALQALIDRKLVVQAAKRDGIDKQPDAILAGERAKDIALVNRALQSLSSRLPQQVNSGDIENYITKHPELDRDRQILLVEQIRFLMPNDPKFVASLKPAKTLGELINVLSSQGISYQRATVELDSVNIDQKAFGRLISTIKGEPLLILEGETAIANHVISMRPAETKSIAVNDLAKQRLVRDRIQEGIVQHQAALRSAAKVEYAKPLGPNSRADR